jgi:hypothetical protein
MAFAKKMGHIGPFVWTEMTEGLNLDPIRCKFEHKGNTLDGTIDTQTQSEISMILYYDRMQRSYGELERIRQELTDLYD